MKRRTTQAGKGRFYHPRHCGTIHASQSLAQFAASFYFRLARGTAAQREAAEEWRTMFLNLPQLINQ